MNTPEELIRSMQDIKYGWVEKDGTKHDEPIRRSLFEKGFFLQSPKEIEKNKIGVCWDQTEYERKFFEEKKIPYKTIFIMYDTGIKKHMHTFLVYKDKKEYCWIENTYPNFIGINRYPSMKELLKDVMKDFLLENHLLVIGENIKYYMYNKPKYGINCVEFIENALKGELLEPDYSNLGI